MKKTSLFLLILMLFHLCAPITFGSESAVMTSANDKMELLIQLEVYDDTTEPWEVVTRGTFAQILSRILGVDLSEGPEYSDVPNTHPNYRGIHTAVSARLLVGYSDGTFRPNGELSETEALVGLVRLLNQETFANIRGGYPTGYYLVAKDSGISRGVVNTEEALTYNELAKLLVNTLNADVTRSVAQNDTVSYITQYEKTLFWERYRIKKVQGVVSGNAYTLLDAESSLSAEEVLIGDTIFNVGYTDGENLLGYYVEGYANYTDEDNPRLVWIKESESKNETVMVDSEFISGETTLHNFVYWDDNGRTMKMEISRTADLIYNGKAETGYTKEDLFPTYGEVVLIDNNLDGKVDVVLVRSYEIYIVDSINISHGKINVKYDKPPIDISDSQTQYALYKDGFKTELLFLEEWSVLAVTASKDNKLIIGYVTLDSIEGTVTGLSGDEVIIQGENYKLVPGGTQGFSIGISGEFYLDHNGRIVAFRQDSTSMNYGYLIKGVETLKGVKHYVEMQIYDAIVSQKVINVAVEKPIIIDGENIMLEHIISTLTGTAKLSNSNADYPLAQVLRFRLNQDGELVEIDTAYNGPKEDTQGTLRLDLPYRQQLLFKGTILGGMVGVDGSSVVMVIPRNLDDLNGYRSSNRGYFTYDGSYDLEAYNFNSTRIAGLLTVYDNRGGSISIIDSMFLTDKISKGINNEGEFIYHLHGTYSGQYTTLELTGETVFNNRVFNPNGTTQNVSKKIKEYEESELLAAIKPGDAFGVSLESGQRAGLLMKYISLDEVKYKRDNNQLGAVLGVGTAFSSKDWLTFSKAYAKKGNIMNLSFDNDNKDIRVFTIPRVAIFDGKKESAYVGNRDDIVAVKEVGDELADYVLLYTYYGISKDVLLYKNLD